MDIEPGLKPRKLLGLLVSGAIVIATVVLGLIVLDQTSHHPRTDDAEILANFIGIAPQVEGKFFSAFIRAGKPTSSAKACCGSDCCS